MDPIQFYHQLGLLLLSLHHPLQCLRTKTDLDLNLNYSLNFNKEFLSIASKHKIIGIRGQTILENRGGILEMVLGKTWGLGQENLGLMTQEQTKETNESTWMEQMTGAEIMITRNSQIIMMYVIKMPNSPAMIMQGKEIEYRVAWIQTTCPLSLTCRQFKKSWNLTRLWIRATVYSPTITSFKEVQKVIIERTKR